MWIIREALKKEYHELGTLMVDVYSQLPGFPGLDEIPEYYDTLRNVGEFAAQSGVKLFVAVTVDDEIGGGLVYFGDMQNYGAGDPITLEQNAAAFRLLAVRSNLRGQGLASKLIDKCLEQAREEGHHTLMIHSTQYMKAAMQMYKRRGFERFPLIDFERAGVYVYGFKIVLD